MCDKTDRLIEFRQRLETDGFVNELQLRFSKTEIPNLKKELHSLGLLSELEHFAKQYSSQSGWIYCIYNKEIISIEEAKHENDKWILRHHNIYPLTN